MATTTPRNPHHEAAPLPPAKVEDNTLDEQHAGIEELEFPVTDNDQSTESGQAHVASKPRDDRPEAEREEESRGSS